MNKYAFITCALYVALSIFLIVLLIENMLYVVWMYFVLSGLPNVFLLMKLVSSALPYVLIFEIVDNIVSAIFMLLDPYINLRLEKVSI